MNYVPTDDIILQTAKYVVRPEMLTGWGMLIETSTVLCGAPTCLRRSMDQEYATWKHIDTHKEMVSARLLWSTLNVLPGGQSSIEPDLHTRNAGRMRTAMTSPIHPTQESHWIKKHFPPLFCLMFTSKEGGLVRPIIEFNFPQCPGVPP